MNLPRAHHPRGLTPGWANTTSYARRLYPLSPKLRVPTGELTTVLALLKTVHAQSVHEEARGKLELGTTGALVKIAHRLN